MRGRVVLNLQLILGLFVAAMLLSLTGCANQSATQTTSTSSRWTEGRFDQLLTAKDQTPLVSRQNDCRVQSTSPASQQWALVHVRRVPGQVYRVVPAPEAQALVNGQKVWINACQCQVRTSAAS